MGSTIDGGAIRRGAIKYFLADGSTRIQPGNGEKVSRQGDGKAAAGTFKGYPGHILRQYRATHEESIMSRRIALLLVMATLLSLGGCVVYPGHYHHCCYRYGYYR